MLFSSPKSLLLKSFFNIESEVLLPKKKKKKKKKEKKKRKKKDRI